MATPNINLKSLEFEDIKNELVAYLKSQSDFSDYDFEGSALSTIVDLLAYNTFYQIFFQNILVNEMFIDSAQKLESIISHAKLLGFAVPGKQSSIATLRVRADSTGTIPAYTRFRGVKNNAEIKLFYNLTSETVRPVGGGITEAIFPVYEASSFVNGQLLPFDVDSQSSFIPDLNVDLRTIKVEVSTDGGSSFEEYIVQSTVEPVSSLNSNFCFIDRTESGYDIKFTGSYDENSGVFYYGTLPSDSLVKVTYLVSSGSAGNGASSFSFAQASPVPNPTIVSVNGASATGKDEPSIEELKFNLPRIFSAQSRVVTKSDLKSFLIENGFAEDFDSIFVEDGPVDRDPVADIGKVYYRTIPDLENVGEGDGRRQLSEQMLGDRGVSGIVYQYDETIGSD